MLIRFAVFSRVLFNLVFKLPLCCSALRGSIGDHEDCGVSWWRKRCWCSQAVSKGVEDAFFLVELLLPEVRSFLKHLELGFHRWDLGWRGLTAESWRAWIHNPITDTSGFGKLRPVRKNLDFKRLRRLIFTMSRVSLESVDLKILSYTLHRRKSIWKAWFEEILHPLPLTGGYYCEGTQSAQLHCCQRWFM